MEPADELAQTYLNKEPQTPTPAKTKRRPSSDVPISRIFRIFRTDYGTAWTSRFTSQEALDEAKARWASKLSRLTPKQIAYGLENMGEIHTKYPPHLQDFISLCKQEGGYRPKCAAHKWFPQETIKVSDKATGEAWIRKWKQDLGMI